MDKMKKLFVATNNLYKLKELETVLQTYQLLTPKDYDSYEPEETGNTYEENALIKARFWHKVTNLPTIADDSGLNIVALDNWPGVYTADLVKKYGTYEKSKKHIQEKLSATSDYRAFFISVVAYIDEKGGEFIFKGRLDGIFIFSPLGNDGFAYDDVFQPSGYNQTIAELGIQWKRDCSHRALSIQQFMIYIKP